MTTTHALSFTHALEVYTTTLQKMINDHYAQSFPSLSVPQIAITEGKRYVRVVRADIDKDGKSTGASVHSFIDKTNGNILKGNWKAPVANGVRGSIYSDFTKVVSAYGCNYLR